MFSFIKSKSSDNVAVIIDAENGLNHKKVLQVEAEGKKPNKEIILRDEEQFMIYPKKTAERVYIVGPNGSGKSWQAGKYCESYNMLYPKHKIVMFSPHEKDEAYARVKNLVIVNLNDPELTAEPLDITRLDNKLVIFDDCDNHQDKKTKSWLDSLEKDIIMNGRKYGIYTLSICHMMMNGASTRHKIAEAGRTVFFPSSGSTYHIKRYLQVYCGLSKEQIMNILNIQSRWVCISNTYPQYLLWDRGALLLK